MNLDHLTKEQCVRFAIDCAERALPIFEAEYPKDKRPREAIEAAKAWLVDPSIDTTTASMAADDAAAKAAYADAAAYAANAAAYAAYAAYAAANAAYAAYAARAARASKDKEVERELQEKFLKELENEDL